MVYKGDKEMTVTEIQNLFDNLVYWDARVLQLECNYFADEIALVFEDEDKNVICNFIGCYKSVFDYIKTYDKLRPVKEMCFSQIPYFLQDIQIGEIKEEGINFLTCDIDMFPLYLQIWCKDIKISK